MEDRLQKFVNLIDAGSFVRAARTLHVSQPALSVAIAKLERELKAPLLQRGVRPLAMTLAGEIAYAAGKDIAVRTGNLRALLNELAERKVSVSLGMIDSVAGALLAAGDLVSQLEQTATVSLVVDNSHNLLRLLETGQLDLAFVAGRRNYDRVFEVQSRAAERLVLVCARIRLVEYNRALQTGVLPHFISYNQTSTTHQLVTETLHARRLAPEPSFYSTSPEVMLRLVLLGKGAAALPYQLVRPELQTGSIALVGEPEPITIERPIHVVKRRGTILPAPLTVIAEQLQPALT